MSRLVAHGRDGVWAARTLLASRARAEAPIRSAPQGFFRKQAPEVLKKDKHASRIPLGRCRSSPAGASARMRARLWILRGPPASMAHRSAFQTQPLRCIVGNNPNKEQADWSGQRGFLEAALITTRQLPFALMNERLLQEVGVDAVDLCKHKEAIATQTETHAVTI
jgi:hypothetical protein